MIDFENITESGPFTIVKWKNTAGWPIEYASKNIKLLTGYAVEDYLSENVNYFDLLNDQDINNIDHQVRAAQLEMRDQFKLEKYSITHRNKTTIWIEEYITILRNETGNVSGFIGYLLDISDRIKTEDNLETSRNETRALINALPDTILQISKNGELKKYLLHKSEPPTENKAEVYLSDVFPTDFASRVPQYLDQVIKSKSINIYEYEKKLLDQKTHYFEARFSEKSSDDALIIIRDITDRKENEQLLKQAIKDVESANNEKTKFLSNMSHELRTPLNAIIGFSQLLISDDISDSELAEEILNAGDHLLTLINDILDISAIEAGKTSLSIEPVSLAAIINECESIIIPFAKRSNISFAQNNSLPDTLIMVDKTRIMQVLLNLLSNAIKYNKPNGSVTLDTEIVDKKSLCIKITDTGIGLTPQQISKLFKPFERVGAENSAIQGTGLGLALTKNLMELMQGNIGVESNPDTGTVFWITLNIAQDNEKSTAPPNDRTSKQSGTTDKKPLSILYIEDNPQNQRLIKTFISQMTIHKIHIVNNGQEGIITSHTLIPDIILLDINLPDISGYEVLKNIKGNKATKHIPVIAISANATKNDLKKAQQADFHCYLTKPINLSELLDTLNNI